MSGQAGVAMTAQGERAGEYCRAIEAHLCRRNGGHLVRIVGPAFQMVCGWHAQGMPLKVVQQGIDRTIEREHAKGPQRRPVRVEFCEADVLDAFDTWRRAVGVHARGARGAAESPVPGDAPPEPAPIGRTRTPPLQAHVDRAMGRLTQCRVDAGVPGPLQSSIDDALAALDGMRDAAKRLRGEARAAFVERLRSIDGELVSAAYAALDARTRTDLDRQTRQEIAPFAGRMSAAAQAQAFEAARAGLVREHWRLPDLTAGL